MPDHTERGTLNHLIETCRDGERGFRYAANHVKTADVKELFLEVAGQRERFADELIPYAQRLGGHEDGEGTFAASLHRSWMGIRDAIAGHDEKAIIREVERGESAALTASLIDRTSANIGSRAPGPRFHIASNSSARSTRCRCISTTRSSACMT